MELTRKFRKPHDQHTGLNMILQVPLTLVLLLAACLLSVVSLSALSLLFLLLFIHIPRAFRLLISKRDGCVLLLPLLFTIRNLCWLWAAVAWGIRSIGRGYIAWQRE